MCEVQSLVVHDGARSLVRGIAVRSRSGRVLLVGSARAVESAGFAELLADLEVHRFSQFTPNPVLADALAGSAVRERCEPDLVVAVGGGSAIDTAKLLRSLPSGQPAALRMLSGDEPPPRGRPPLVAVPTTAGSGSEVTSFATVYVGRVKASLDDPTVRPEHAVVDPDLLRSCPGPLMYAGAFDALCRAVESFWSARATPASRRLALCALDGVVRVLGGDPVHATDAERRTLAMSATAAGFAIDVTRTTAAHAFSYRLTARFGVSHGVACLLNLCWLLPYNERHGADPGTRRDLAVLRSALDPLAPGQGRPKR
jgi:alcohol dehydrogenase class IV